MAHAGTVCLMPLLFHPTALEKPPRVAVIGYGSGVTIGAVTQFPIGHADVVELEPEIVYALQQQRKHVQQQRNIVEQPRKHVVRWQPHVVRWQPHVVRWQPHVVRWQPHVVRRSHNVRRPLPELVSRDLDAVP